MRGEYPRTRWGQGRCSELPPRARRIRLIGPAINLAVGTTSACAENTSPTWWQPPQCRNYLRVRGEYAQAQAKCCYPWELPPRARRILLLIVVAAGEVGTTSACAENTTLGRGGAVASGNYLRVRREYFSVPSSAFTAWELPPRARRILYPGRSTTTGSGTTSACAENTQKGPGRLL